MHACEKLSTTNLVRTSTDHQILWSARSYWQSILAHVCFRCHGINRAMRHNHRWAESLKSMWHISQKVFFRSHSFQTLKKHVHMLPYARYVSYLHGVTCLTVYGLNWVVYGLNWVGRCQYQVAIGRLRGRTKETTKAKRPSQCVYIDRGGKPVNILFDAHCVKLPVRHTGEQPSSDVMGRPSYIDRPLTTTATMQPVLGTF